MITPDLRDDELRRRLDGLAPDGLTIFTLEGDSIRGALVSATTMVAEMRAAHGLGPLETEVLGRAYVAAALL
ncbi:MAG TPA: Hsp33 family molecular chaperone HslO, partial [Spirochaetia bacterium]|nr:Hsp33 family molecular chaperone HslO [Spirochaetia bacterium]